MSLGIVMALRTYVLSSEGLDYVIEDLKNGRISAKFVLGSHRKAVVQEDPVSSHITTVLLAEKNGWRKWNVAVEDSIFIYWGGQMNPLWGIIETVYKGYLRSQ